MGFREFNKAMVMLWRLGLGRAVNVSPSVGGRILVLTTTGRKSGLPRRTPLNFHRDGDEVFVLAGYGASSDWYRNLQATREAEVWLPDGRWRVRARPLRKDRLARLRQVLVDSGFAAPMFAGIWPRSASDEDLARGTEAFEVVRLTLVEKMPGSPADLRWVWGAALGAAAGVAVARRVFRW